MSWFGEGFRFFGVWWRGFGGVFEDSWDLVVLGGIKASLVSF